MAGRGSRLIAILLVVVVVTSAVSYWLYYPKPITQIVSHTSEQTSLEVRRTSEQTLGSSSSLATVAPETTLWLNVTTPKPVSYYGSLLKSVGTQPYVELGWELQALPDASNATAVAKITYLALNATNPEVKEAFQLMIKGGTPAPSDYRYTVPNYNTELQVLYWLACQNEFKKEDTLALAVALVNGIWVTVGNEDVRQAVKKDSSDLLAFFRETNEIQRSRGYSELERYPLEAKICLAYTSSIGTFDGQHSISRMLAAHADLKKYDWVRYDVGLLLRMRKIAIENNWWEGSVDSTVGNIEDYFYSSGFQQHWIYSTGTPGVTESLIEVEGELIPPHWVYNLQFYLDSYVSTGKVMGDCGDETYFMEAWGKSLGIATDFVIHQIIDNGVYYGHAHIIYYEPATRTWKAYAGQLSGHYQPSLSYYVFTFRPPVKLPAYFAFSPIKEARMGYSGTVYVARYTSDEFQQVFQNGCPSSQMKQWLLYS